MPGHDHGSQVKNDELYEKLREEGNSKEKAARIANAHEAGTLHPRGADLEDRSR
ncbi:Rho termination factor, partial [Escherichia coli]|nr:Rho termination factor [Escherichia coli]